MELLNYFTLSEILELQDIPENEVLELLIKEELIDLLMGFPEDEKVIIPDWSSTTNHWEIKNLVLSKEGVLIDY